MEVVSQIIEQLEELIKEAPGRQEKDFFFSQFKQEFMKNEKYLRDLMKTHEEPIKVVVMGEVKAGKSTLINSILQKNISYMNAAEATALIHHFVYSEESYGKLMHKDGSTYRGSLEEIQAMIENHQKDGTSIRNYEAVEFGLPLEVLKRFDLVDTPGIGTVTRENEKLTKDFIYQADIVLWVFNSHYIGQSNIREAVMNVMEEGKQVIGVLNRMDEVDLSSEELIASAKRWIRFIDSFHPVSAYKALESMRQGKEDSYGITELLQKIEDCIGPEKKEAKRKAVTDSLCSLIEREISWHEQMNQMASEIGQRLLQHEVKLQAAHKELSEEIYKNYLCWLERDFMLGELNQFYHAKNNKEELLKLQDAYFKEEYISQCMEEKVMQLSDYLKDRWIQKARNIDQELVKEIKNYVRSYVKTRIEASPQAQVRLEEAEVMISQDESGLADEFVKGATVGTVIASLAFLGPTATQITFIGMASSVLPIAVIGGVITTIYKKNKIKNADSKECEELYKSITKSMMHLRDELMEEAEQSNPFEALSGQIFMALRESVAHHLSLQDPAHIQHMKEEVEQYKMKLNAVKDRLLTRRVLQGIIIKESMDEIEKAIEIDQDLLDLLG